jgi:hypothetical protein
MVDLNSQQRDLLRSKVWRDISLVPDDQLVAWLVLLGHSLDEIDEFCKDFG